MTIQFSFFATERDSDLIASELYSVFGTFYVLRNWMPLGEMVPLRISKSKDLVAAATDGTWYLFGEGDIQSAVIAPVPKGVHCVKFRDCACLEYDPCVRLADGTVRIGRFAYFYTEDDEFRKKVQRLFRRLRKHARKVPNSFAWVMDDATRNASQLCYTSHGEMRLLKPNPFLVAEEG